MTLLAVRDLTAGYGGAPVLRDVTLDVGAGEITAVLGANGAGKTTLLRAVSGLLKPRSGSIALDGAEIGGQSPERLVRMGLSHVPEGGGVIVELTVMENLRLGGLWRRDRADAARAAGEVLDRFPALAKRRDQLGHQLSGGERQMLAIGRALVARPRLLLLDEPSLGLAPRVTGQIMELLRTLCDSGGLAVLIVEQNTRAALGVADNGVVIASGQVVRTAPAAQIAGDDGLRHAYLGF